MNSVRKVFAAVFVVFASFCLQSQAQAACSIATPLDCVTNPGSIGSGEALGEYQFHVKNSCHLPMWVAIYYMPIYDGSHSTLACVGCENPQWLAHGWWNLKPGEKAFVATTHNKYVYVHAETEGKELFWGDEKGGFEFEGEYLNGFEVSMGNSFNIFTQNLTCN